MKHKKLLAVLAALALMAQSVAAQGTTVSEKNPFRGQLQGQAISGIYRPDSTGRLVTVDANGNLLTSEQYPASGYQLIQPSILSTQFLHIPGASPSGTVVADSCAPISVQGFTRLALLVYPTSNDSIESVCIGFSWRLHASSIADTQSTYIELPWNRFKNNGAGVVATDSLAFKPDTIGTTSVHQWNLQASTGGPAVAANDKTAMIGENVLVFSQTSASRVATFPRGRVIYLTNKDGQPVSGAYISFYWRHLVTYLNNTAKAQATAGQEVRLRLRADLVGWR